MAWYHTFFEGLPQTAWKMSQQEEYTHLEVDFLWDLLDLAEDQNVLDVFAGQGRHALPIARNRVKVWAVDISKEACEELQIEAREEFVPVEVLCGDFLETVMPPVTLDAAYCMGNSFSFFDRAEMVTFLQKIASGLKSGGKFVAHSALLAESVLPQFQERSWMEVGEGEDKILYLVNSQYDALSGKIEAQVTYVHQGQEQQYTIDQYIYTLAELKCLFAEAGLTITEVFSDVDGETFRLGDEHIYILAVKE